MYYPQDGRNIGAPKGARPGQPRARPRWEFRSHSCSAHYRR